MFSRALLLRGAGGGISQTIGKAGDMGFGVGVYGGASADLAEMKLTPMDGYDDPSHANYGNYQHENGSVMCFVPAFCYRIGNPTAPSYQRDKENALEIRDAALGEGDGWFLHRAFIDGGQQKSGFFFDKYICSKDVYGRYAVSVKNGDNIVLDSGQAGSNGMMSGCSGSIYDSIALGHARGQAYFVTTAFQWSAIAMLSLAHGQAATSSRWCAWYDSLGYTNYPRGNTQSLKDVNESSVVWTPHSAKPNVGKTGSGTPFNKTTHNGQVSGITDVSGSQWQVALGVTNPSTFQINVMKESVSACDFEIGNRTDSSFFDSVSIDAGSGAKYWGGNAFDARSESGTPRRSLCGVLPSSYQSQGNDLLGRDICYLGNGIDSVLLCSGVNSYGASAGIWARYFSSWNRYAESYGFRIAGYAK